MRSPVVVMHPPCAIGTPVKLYTFLTRSLLFSASSQTTLKCLRNNVDRLEALGERQLGSKVAKIIEKYAQVRKSKCVGFPFIVCQALSLVRLFLLILQCMSIFSLRFFYLGCLVPSFLLQPPRVGFFYRFSGVFCFFSLSVFLSNYIFSAESVNHNVVL